MDDQNDTDREPTDEPIAELGAFAVDADPELPGRVQRAINRNVLASDALELSLAGLVATVWGFVRMLLESLIPSDPDHKER